MFFLHYVGPDENGKIVGDRVVAEDGNVIRPGGRFTMACQPHRRDFGKVKMDRQGKYLGEGTHVRCTPVTALVTCPRCKQTAMFKKDYQPLGQVVREQIPARVMDVAARAGG